MNLEILLTKSTDPVEGFNEFSFFNFTTNNLDKVPRKKLFLIFKNLGNQFDSHEYNIDSKTDKATIRCIVRYTNNINLKYRTICSCRFFDDFLESLKNHNQVEYDSVFALYWIVRNNNYIYFEIVDSTYQYKKIIGFMRK